MTTARPPSIVKPDGVQLVGTGETGTFVEALAFNNRGQVVGFRFTGAEPQRQLFLWTADQGFRDLNVLMLGHSPTDADARITSVADINDWGWIAGPVRAPAQRTPILLCSCLYLRTRPGIVTCRGCKARNSASIFRR